MSKGKGGPAELKELSERQKIIAHIRKKTEGQRTEQDKAHLKTLLREEARDRFVRNANRRVQNALKQLDNVGRLGNKSTYEYTDEEAARIIETLASKLAAVRGAFQGRTKQAGFDLFGK